MARPLCLAHYYTTRMIRSTPTDDVPTDYDGKVITSNGRVSTENKSRNNNKNNSFKVIHQEEAIRQLPIMQQIFAEAYVELQQDIVQTLAKEAASDPLDALFQKKSRRRKTVTSNSNRLKKKSLFESSITSDRMKSKGARSSAMELEERTSGGFFRDSSEQERVLQAHHLQQSQRRLHYSNNKTGDPSAVMTEPSIKATVVKDSEYNPYKRRKPNRKSYWSTTTGGNSAESSQDTVFGADLWKSDDATDKMFIPKCSCGSDNVAIDGNMIGRTADMAKGETWGNKDRDEVLERYHCLNCGKVWNHQA